MMYAWRISDLETSLTLGATFHTLGVSGNMMTLMGAILILESFTLQYIVLIHRRSLLDVDLHINRDQEIRFLQESRLAFKIYSSSKFTLRFLQLLSIPCAFLYVSYFSFSLLSILLSFLSVINTMVHLEFHMDVYMFYCLWLQSVRKLSYSIDCLFMETDKPMNFMLNHFTQVWNETNLLNEISSKVSTTCFIFGVLLNAGMFLAVRSLSKNGDELPILVAVITTGGLLVIFIERLTIFVAVSVPLKKCISMRDRVYRILVNNRKLSWRQQKHLLNIIKSQGNQRTQIALTTIDGRLLETKLLGHHIIYSVRVLVLFLKILKSSS